ncbi:MAG TPA: ComEC/Rec2 family competence protein [Candidatus Nanoarchaeia archaeon]|nr:ComEC/Rec2 family competence protein [Candidatus Nanoarchaeia archaeon]
MLLLRTRWLVFILVVLGLNLGVWRVVRSDLEHQALQGRLGTKVELAGQVIDDPALSDAGYVTFSLGNIQLDGRPVPGIVRVTGPNFKLQRGYRVKANGKLQPTVGSAEGSLFSVVEVVSNEQSRLERLRQRFIVGMRNSLPSPLSDFGLGLLLGSRSLLPKSLQDQLAAVGLSHLVAVSGYNLTILVNFAYRPLRRVSKFWAASVTGWLITAFLLVSGFSASIVRAAIVAGLSLFTAYYGRKPHPLALIAISAAATTAWRPEWLWSDLGWQLSFLAFIGILVVAPALQARFLTKSAWSGLLAESLSAQLLTMPLIALRFSQIPLVGPVANLLILPLVPLMMLLSLLAGLAGLLLPLYAGWISWPASLLLATALELVDWLARLPGAVWAVVLSPLTTTLLYLVGALAVWLMSKRVAGRDEATV